MNVKVDNEVQVVVGDVIEFNHKGSNNECNFYLISHCTYEGFFIMNLSGRKSNRIKYYTKLHHLIKYHEDSIVKIYSKSEWQLKLSKLG